MDKYLDDHYVEAYDEYLDDYAQMGSDEAGEQLTELANGVQEEADELLECLEEIRDICKTVSDRYHSLPLKELKINNTRGGIWQ